MNGFAQSALSLCERMSTRVPPYIISNDEKYFMPELHELKSGPDPDETEEKIPVSYLRPIAYFNYDGSVLIKGKVIGTLGTSSKDIVAGT